MMLFSPVKYDEPLFRPPSEAYSVILQITKGCSWNKCAFCEMYTSKTFSLRNEKDIFSDIDSFAEYAPDTRKVFLADGNAMVLSTDKLLRILNYCKLKFPKLNRVSAYAIAKDLEKKSLEELKLLHDEGLKLLYIGIESGDDEILAFVNKGENCDSTKRNFIKLKKSGIKSSVMILTGLGGVKYTRQHAVNSARLINEVAPDFLSTLVLSFPYGIDHFKHRFKGDYVEMNVLDLLKEQHLFISGIDIENVVFRSDHASNYLSLKGILSRDKQKLLANLESAINKPQFAGLREEWQRGL